MHADKRYFLGERGLGAGYAYGGSLEASKCVKMQRRILVSTFIMIIVFVCICVHITILGVLWLSWDPSFVYKVLLSGVILVFLSTITLLKELVSSDVNIAEKKRLVEPASNLATKNNSVTCIA